MAGIELSEEAYRVLRESGAEDLLIANLEVLLDILFQRQPGTVGAIYDAAVEAIKELQEQRPDLLENIQAYADAQQPFLFGQLLMLMSCYLRDEALKRVEIIE